MILADSIRQTASIARCVGVVVTATHHTIFKSLAQAAATRSAVRLSTSVGVTAV